MRAHQLGCEGAHIHDSFCLLWWVGFWDAADLKQSLNSKLQTRSSQIVAGSLTFFVGNATSEQVQSAVKARFCFGGRSRATQVWRRAILFRGSYAVGSVLLFLAHSSPVGCIVEEFRSCLVLTS